MKTGNQKMTRAKALQLIKKHRPKTLLAAHGLGLRMRHIGSGGFRAAYRINNTNLVIKFPDPGDYECAAHAEFEAKIFKKLAKIPILRKYLPEIYYFDPISGVTVGEFYPKAVTVYNKNGAFGELIGDLIKKVSGVYVWDVKPENTRFDSSGQLKLIDLGC